MAGLGWSELARGPMSRELKSKMSLWISENKGCVWGGGSHPIHTPGSTTGWEYHKFKTFPSLLS